MCCPSAVASHLAPCITHFQSVASLCPTRFLLPALSPTSPTPPFVAIVVTQALMEGLDEFERCAGALGGWRHVCIYRTGRRLVEARRAAPELWRLKPGRHGYELIQVSCCLAVHNMRAAPQTTAYRRTIQA